ncbi:MAG: M23 family metallopeptidase, partial [bacterium]|nr:M23 family metallopeptidase [bacterium]
MRRILSFHVPSSWPVFVALLSWCLFFAAFLSACRQSLLEDWSSQTKSNLVACGVSTVRYPTNREGFDRLYQNRGFYKDGNHLGRDLALPEGTPIHPIACGTVRYFGPASGYGTLVVVIEHRLSEPRIVKNGLEEQVTTTSFLSTYGHMTFVWGGARIAIRVGDTVSPEDVIGYIENDARNGDGAEHLHFGIRLQTMSAAQATDQSWFRGYDTTPSQLRWFADPAGFLDVLMTQGIAVRSHPMGTVLTDQRETGLAWMVGEHDDLLQIDPFDMESEHLTSHCIPTSEEELACYAKGSAYQPELTASQLLKFDDASAVYEYQNRPSPVRYVFISQEAFNSWGWKNTQIVTKPASERPAFFARYQDKGFRRLRDGSLVKGRWASEVSVVSNGRR